MAIRFAVKTGNWSDPTTWDNGALPVAGDDVYSNGFVVTIDQSVNVNSLRNTANPVYLPNDAIPAMTSTTTPSGVVNATGNVSGQLPWYAFDQNTGSYWQISTLPAFISYQFPTAKIIKQYAFYTSGSDVPKTWTFDGSNDGSTWTTLDTRNITTSASTWYVFSLANTTAYTYYRINVTSNTVSTSFVRFAEINMTESTGTVYGGTTGGSFTLTAGTSVTSNLGFTGSGTTLMNYSGSGSITLNGGLATADGNRALIHSGTGTVTINGNVQNGATGNSGNVITISGSGTLTINGNVIVFTTTNQFGALVEGIVMQGGASTLNITGNVTGPSEAYSASPVCIATRTAGQTINIIGNLYAGTTNNSSRGSTVTAIRLEATSTVNITGNVYGGGNTTVHVSYAITANVASTINITGNVIAGSLYAAIISSAAVNLTIVGSVYTTSSSVAVNLTGASVSNVTGVITASSSAPAFVSSSASSISTCTGPFISNNNVTAVAIAKLLLTSTPTYWRFQSDARTMYTADYNPDYPSTLNVRSGTSYGSGMTGTMIVPAANTVAMGVPVDNTVGTAANSATAVQDAVWGKLTSTMTTADSIGERVKNALTQDTLGNLLTSL